MPHFPSSVIISGKALNLFELLDKLNIYRKYIKIFNEIHVHTVAVFNFFFLHISSPYKWTSTKVRVYVYIFINPSLLSHLDISKHAQEFNCQRQSNIFSMIKNSVSAVSIKISPPRHEVSYFICLTSNSFSFSQSIHINKLHTRI